MILSYISSPARWDLNDPEQVARLVRAELLAGIRWHPPPFPLPRPGPTAIATPAGRSSVICARCDKPICTDCMIQAAVGGSAPSVCTRGPSSPVQRMTFNRNRTGMVGSTNPTPAVLTLIAINMVVFVASGFGRESVIIRFGEWPYAIHVGHQYYRFFDSMFLHLTSSTSPATCWRCSSSGRRSRCSWAGAGSSPST